MSLRKKDQSRASILMDEVALRTEALKDDIRRAAAESKLSKSIIAQRAGVHINTLVRMYDEDWSPALSTLDRLERLLIKPLWRSPPPPASRAGRRTAGNAKSPAS